MSGGALSWARDGRDWPNREASQFIEAGGLVWHVQIKGEGPPLLLLHGTGASTHSWRDLLPQLAPSFTVIAPDLPGHGFTAAEPPERMSMAQMALSVAALLRRLDVAPQVAVGHSAGAALLVWMTLEHLIAPAGIVSFNGAFLPIDGLAGQIFPPLARMLAGSSTAAAFFSLWAGLPTTTGTLIAQTGSRLDAQGLAFYRRLAGNPVHVGAALAMMANWNLDRLERRLPAVTDPLVLVVGTRDGSVLPVEAEMVRRRVRGAVVEKFRGLGHLAHEEDPSRSAELIRRHAAAWGVAAP